MSKRHLIALALCGTGLMVLALWSGCDDIGFTKGNNKGAGDAQTSYEGSCGLEAGATPAAQADGGAGGPGVTGDSGSNPGAGAPGALPMTVAAIGSPTWKPHCAFAFAAPCGSKSTSFSTAVTTIEKVLPAHRYDKAHNVMAPVTAHAHYDLEIPQGLAAFGLKPKDSFSVAELQAPSCVFVVLQLVPGAGAPTGASPDFASGPILSPAAFPLLIDGALLTGGKVVDPGLGFVYPGMKSLSPQPSGDSYSHVPLVLFENSELVQAQAGTYSVDLRVLDAGGQGWSIRVGYSVK